MKYLIILGMFNWWSILIGAIVGTVLGFSVSELKSWFIEYRLKNKLVKAFKPYCGNYSVYIKGRGSTDIQSVTIPMHGHFFRPSRRVLRCRRRNRADLLLS